MFVNNRCMKVEDAIKNDQKVKLILKNGGNEFALCEGDDTYLYSKFATGYDIKDTGGLKALCKVDETKQWMSLSYIKEKWNYISMDKIGNASFKDNKWRVSVTFVEKHSDGKVNDLCYVVRHDGVWLMYHIHEAFKIVYV
ncbi:hypothetical protein O9G_004585 [Rozella allomycis CSF55]|uniref:Uncharacterized protein n=1 Tax=Rozella allomycis (strain CSF55) TaxID=988480 RepID=A0A075B566_ROZAC|nr:hypothetical protein O9G_004585 [Rozella allomycis CSF55]|eukprot:EPZ36793.1 hypothetical protein O9G_004585 [Rozella allomycis CSF55]